MMATRRPSVVVFVGFLIGFLLGLLILSPKGENFPTRSVTEPLCGRTSVESLDGSGKYELWLASQGVVRSPLDFDEYLYGPRRRQATLEAEFLKKRVYVTCVVSVTKERNLLAASHTWLKHCNDFSLYRLKRPQDRRGKDFAIDLGVRTIEAKSSWDFLCQIVLHIWRDKKSEMQWLLFVSDDMFVVPENLRRMVAHLDPSDSYYLGHAQRLWGQPFNTAIAGYVMSRGTAKLLVANFTSETCSSGGKYWKKDDYYLGKNLGKLCVLPSDTRDNLGKGRFHGYNLNQLLFSNKLALIASYWKDSIYPSTEGKNCCSDLSVTFQGIEADKMYMYDYIINRLNVFTHGRHGSHPAPTPYPSEQVWKDFMRSRGFTSVENLSDKQYFEAWKSKINEDLIKAGLTKKQHVWRGVDLKNGDGHGEVIPLPFQFDTVLDTE